MNNKKNDLYKDKIMKIKEILPEIVEDNKINIEKFIKIIDGYETKDDYNYAFTWPGKDKAIEGAYKQTTLTLKPNLDKSINFQDTKNVYIEGDNLYTLKVLRDTYANSVKFIYIDPPYNTGGEFVYNDDFEEPYENYLKLIGYVDEKGNKTTTSQDTSGRKHTNWLNMMYPRLLIAKDLLKDDGVIFISISDDEQANLKKICDEILGESSFVTTLHVEMSATQGMKVKAAQNGNIVKNSEYILVYSKDGRKNIAINKLYDYRDEYDTHYSKILVDGDIYNLLDYVKENNNDIKDQIESLNNILGKTMNLKEVYEYSPLYKEYVIENASKIFRFDKVTGFTEKDIAEGEILEVERNNRYYTIANRAGKVDQLLFLKDSIGETDNFRENYGLRKIRGDWWKEFYLDMGNVSKEGNVKLDNGKKPKRLIKQLINMATEKDDIILDFFAGSSTTAHAVIEQNLEDNGNRKYVLIQLPEKLEKNQFSTITELGQQRIINTIEEFKTEYPEKKFDDGFKVFELSKTNFPQWNEDLREDEIIEQLDLLDREVNDEIGAIYELMLLLKIYKLDEKVVQVASGLYSLGDQNKSLVTVVEKLTSEMYEWINKNHKDYYQVIIYDNALTQEQKFNLLGNLGEKLNTI